MRTFAKNYTVFWAIPVSDKLFHGFPDAAWNGKTMEKNSKL